MKSTWACFTWHAARRLDFAIRLAMSVLVSTSQETFDKQGIYGTGNVLNGIERCREQVLASEVAGGQTLKMYIMKSSKAFLASSTAKQIDLATTNPDHCIEAAEQPGETSFPLLPFMPIQASAVV